MPEGHVLEFHRVTKRFGAVPAVSDFSARIEPGVVTGFLGPNGAGKTTTLRILLGLVRASEGTATIGGQPYAKLAQPLQTVGAVLEASSFHPGRTAVGHLRTYARAASISFDRVDEVLALVGLADAAGRKVGGFSLGMRQRLGVAYALLGDPGVLVLDEPSNGLDPEGIRWMRGFLRQLAREGRTVLVSSHLLTEIQQTVDALVVIAQGRLVFQGGLEELVDPSEYATVVDSPDRAALAAALTAAELPTEVLRSGLTVRGFDPAIVGRAAADAGVPLSLLQRRGPALEEVFLELVSGERVHASASGLPPAAAVAAAPLALAASEPASEPTPEPASEPTPEPESTPAPEPDDAIEAVSLTADPGWDDLISGDTTPPVDSPPVDSPPLDSAPVDAAPRPAFAVAATGVIDIVPEDEGSIPEESIPEDSDPDVEALGEIDEELSTPDLDPDPDIPSPDAKEGDER